MDGTFDCFELQYFFESRQIIHNPSKSILGRDQQLLSRQLWIHGQKENLKKVRTKEILQKLVRKKKTKW